jgi:cytochrome c553
MSILLKLLLFFGLARKMFFKLTYPSLVFVAFTYLLPAGHSAFAVERSKALFELCVACHGDQGQGNEKLAAPAIAGLSAWYLEAQLTKFRAGGRGAHPSDFGGLRMRPMARSLSVDTDVKLVADYVSKLKPTESQQVVTGSVVRGEGLYQTCAACHGADAKGNQTVFAPPLTISSDWYLVTQLKHFKAGIRGGNPTLDPTGATMRGMAATLDEQGMQDVVYYIQTLK